jgi:hypothetical protein
VPQTLIPRAQAVIGRSESEQRAKWVSLNCLDIWIFDLTADSRDLTARATRGVGMVRHSRRHRPKKLVDSWLTVSTGGLRLIAASDNQALCRLREAPNRTWAMPKSAAGDY